MNDREQDIFSKALRAGRRTYFFDVKSTKAGDYYLTITESKKFTNEDGSFHFKKHKIYLYKEDFNEFKSILEETTNFIIGEKGETIISDYNPSSSATEIEKDDETKTSDSEFTDLKFEDI
jgi:hypothetical protein